MDRSFDQLLPLSSTYNTDITNMYSVKSDHERVEHSSKTDFDYHAAFRDGLTKAERYGEVSCFRREDAAPNPGLAVDGVGSIGLPLTQDQARKVIARCHQAPFGKGEQTLIDTSVRKTWELNPTEFQLKNKAAWDPWLHRVVDGTATSLGLRDGTSVRAELYKLLLYEEGALFKPHQDTEKAPGMFGTLVVCLPSVHSGGELRLKHKGEEWIYSTADASEFGTSTAAWYSDVIHEVKPVTSGYRLVVTYNLIRTAADVPATAEEMCDRSRNLKTTLERWKHDENAPTFLVHMLEHKYTKSSLGPASLKGDDATHLATLKAAITGTNFKILLATMTREVFGGCEDDGRWNSCKYCDRSDPDNGPHGLMEEDEVSLKLEGIMDLEARPIAPEILIDNEVIVQEDPWGGRNPDEEDYQGWTGNEGAQATQWYRDAVIIVLPLNKMDEFILEPAIAGKVNPLPILVQCLDDAITNGVKNSNECNRLLTFCTALTAQVKMKDQRYNGTAHGMWSAYGMRSDKNYLTSDELHAKIAEAALFLEQYTLFNDVVSLTAGRDPKHLMEKLDKKITMGNLPHLKESLISWLKQIASITERWAATLRLFACIDLREMRVSAPDSANDEDVLVREAKLEILTPAFQDLSLMDHSKRQALKGSDGEALAHIASLFPDEYLTQFIVPTARDCTSNPEFLTEFLVHLKSRLYNTTYRDTVSIAYGQLLQLAGRKIDVMFMLPESGGTHNKAALHSFCSSYWSLPQPNRPWQDGLAALEVGLRIPQLLRNCYEFGHAETANAILFDLQRQLCEIKCTEKEYTDAIFPLLARILQSLRDVSFKYLSGFLSTCIDSIFQRMIGRKPKEGCERTLPPISCRCVHCEAVNRFLSNPTEADVSFRHNAGIRSHIEKEISQYVWAGRLKTETVRVKSPHIIRISKSDGGTIKAISKHYEQLKFGQVCLQRFPKDALADAVGSGTPFLQELFPSHFSPAWARAVPNSHGALAEQANPPATATNALLGKRKYAETIDLT